MCVCTVCVCVKDGRELIIIHYYTIQLARVHEFLTFLSMSGLRARSILSYKNLQRSRVVLFGHKSTYIERRLESLQIYIIQTAHIYKYAYNYYNNCNLYRVSSHRVCTHLQLLFFNLIFLNNIKNNY